MFGVIGIDLSERSMDAFENSVLLSILGECALAVENRRIALEKEQATVHAQNEQLGQICCEPFPMIFGRR